MAYYFTRVNNNTAYLYRGKNKKVKGISTRVNEKSIGRLDEIENYIFKRWEKSAKIEVKEYGLTSTLLSIANKLNIETGFHELIETKKNKNNLSRALMLIVLYNICHKGGKLSLKSWYQRTNLSTIYPISPEELEVQSLCRDMDLLEPYINAVEKLICFNILALDNEELDILYFDMTNQYVYVENKDSKLLKNGNSKAKRYDLKQFCLALTASAKSGIPLFHKVYEGNINDVTFFGDYIDELTKKITETGSEPKGKLLIFDKGNNSKDNITKVLGLKYDIIGALKPSEYKELISTPVSDLTETTAINGNDVNYKVLTQKVYGRKMKVVITYDKNTRKRRVHSFEDYLVRLQDKVKAVQKDINTQLDKSRKSKWEIDENVLKKAKGLVAKQYSKLFEFGIIRKGKQAQIQVKIVSEEYDQLQLKFGKNLLFTNKLRLDATEIIRLYRAKDFVEKLFEYMKNFKLIMMEPQYHHKDERIRTNTYLKVVSMQILAYFNKILREKHTSIKIFNAIEELKSIYKVHYVNNETGVIKDISVQLNEKQEELVEKLEIKVR